MIVTNTSSGMSSQHSLHTVHRSIDIHHHFFPLTLDKTKQNQDVGWRTPEGNLPWKPEISLNAMDALGIDFAVLSMPAIATGFIGDENRRAAREHNDFAAHVCSTYPHRFGFFTTLPFLDDVEGEPADRGAGAWNKFIQKYFVGALAELAYALDELNAYGVAISSSYGLGSSAAYIGHDKYDPVWAELHRRKAIVFLHGAQTPSSTPYPHEFLGIPITEVPNETFKAAAHLVVTGRKRKFHDVKIILAHLGGSTPYLAARVAVLSKHMGCALTNEEILEDFKTFYYETALSAYETNLVAMETFVAPDHILFGTDFPAVSIEMVSWYNTNLEGFYGRGTAKLKAVLRENAIKLMPRLGGLVRMNPNE